MRVACFVDTKNKVQHNRVRQLASLFPNMKFDVFVGTKKQKLNVAKYNVVYYASFPLYAKHPVKHRNICGSITSHKCLSDMKRSLALLRHFHRVSANNKLLFDLFSAHLDNVVYIPNGVDTKVFSFKGDTPYDQSNIRLGWVGNTDRATKNFDSLVSPMRKWGGFVWSVVGTRKSKSWSKNHSDMVNFYHGLDFYVVTSTTEGTPNPALEAASCGVPLISTKVGNMMELITEGETGFFADSPKLRSFKQVMNKVRNVDPDRYNKMSHQIHSDVRSSWSWKSRREAYASFLQGK